MVLLDENNVVTLARAVLQHAGSEPSSYANFEIRIDGKLERIGLVDDLPIPQSGPLYLRLEQRGRKILGAVSTDGLKWMNLESKEVPEKWASELQAGVVADQHIQRRIQSSLFEASNAEVTSVSDATQVFLNERHKDTT